MLQQHADSQGKIRLTSVELFDAALEQSGERPVLIFKHSATCPISAAAHEEWLSVVSDPGDTPAPVHTYLIVQEDRPVSNEIAERLGVRHESPQAILLKDGRPVWHTSHQAITRSALLEAIKQASA